MSAYLRQLGLAMAIIGDRPNAVFMGQAVACAGTAMSATFADVPADKLIELPVFEDCQLGMSIGMALHGSLPVSVFPRWNFLLLATNQLVNHLDKLPAFGNGYRPKVIVRTAVAYPSPMDPGPQHLGDFTDAFRKMLTTVHVERLDSTDAILPAYLAALERPGSSLIVERAELY